MRLRLKLPFTAVFVGPKVMLPLFAEVSMMELPARVTAPLLIVTLPIPVTVILPAMLLAPE